MTLLHPAWLLLLLPLFLSFRLRRSRWLTIPRGIIYTLLVLALSGLVIYPNRQGGTVVALVDRSASMPTDAKASALETLGLMVDTQPQDARLAVVTFGERAAVERAPDQGEVSDFTALVGQHGSNLSEGLRLALGLLPEEDSGRILILSDGRWTGVDPRALGVRAATMSVPIDYRFSERMETQDVAIAQLEAPQWVEDGQGFMINAWVRIPEAASYNYELLRNGAVIANGSKSLQAGEQRLSFRDLGEGAGTQAYELRIFGQNPDDIPQNNQASVLVGVRGKRSILLVSPNAQTSLATLLNNSGMKVMVRTPEQVDWSLTELSSYAAVAIENLSANSIGRTGMENLRAWVETTGGGLYMTGGQNSYGPGGYYRSPLEPILPVSMELRREHRKFSMALIVAVDRSGSMGAPVSDNLTKMDLANIAAAEVVKVLSPMDEFGMVAVDTQPYVVVPRQQVTDPTSIRDKVLGLEPGGGGIYVYEALVAAGRMLKDSKAGARHIILFSDAADSEEPGNFMELLDQYTAAGITVSVVGLGTQADPDALLLEDIADEGQGNLYFTTDPQELPRIFTQDTFVMARSAFVDVPSPVALTSGMVALSSHSFSNPPNLGGYNLCYVREGANMAMVSSDEYEAPIVASWFAGSGRVLCFMGEASGAYSGDFASWPDVGAFHGAMAGWAAGGGGTMPDGSLVTQRLKAGLLEVTLHLSPDRQKDPFDTKPKIQVLRGDTGDTPTREEIPLKWSGPDTLVANLPLNGSETLLGSVSVGDALSPLAPARLPYSPEYSPPGPDSGEPMLTELARMTQGVSRARLDSIWSDLAQVRTPYSLTPWLLMLAVLALLVEVLQRRTALVRSWLMGLAPAKGKEVAASTTTPVEPPAQTPAPEQVKVKTAAPTQAAEPAPEAPPTKPAKPKRGGLSSALNKAKDRADRRLK